MWLFLQTGVEVLCRNAGGKFPKGKKIICKDLLKTSSVSVNGQKALLVTPAGSR